MKHNFLLLLFGLFFVCCHADRRVEGAKEAVEQMKSMQIKRVTTPQLIEIVDDWGARIVKQAQRELEQSLSGPQADPAALCRLSGLPRLDSLAALYAVDIHLLGAKDVKSSLLSSEERQILDAYVYNAKNKRSQISNIQKLGDSVLIYNAPIAPDHVICLQCFNDDPQKLAIWRIKFKKAEVIRKVNTKSLEKKKH